MFLKSFNRRLCLMFCLLVLWTVAPVHGGETTKAPEPAVVVQDTENLIKTLENPQQREQLIQQLKLLLEAQKQTEPAPLHSSAAAMIEALSSHMGKFSQNVLSVVNSINKLPQISTWLRQQYDNPDARQLWKEVFVNLFKIIGLGYIVFFLIQRLLAMTAKGLYHQSPAGIISKLPWLLLLFLIQLLPLAAFAATAYVAAGLLDLREQTRLAALAWLNAILFARVVIVVGRVVFTPQAPGLRLLDIDDESAHYAEVWIRRLTVTSVYGYFALQVAVFLGMQEAVYEALLRLLGVLVLALLLVVVMQNREAVATWIVGRDEGKQHLRGMAMRRRAGRVWHLITSVYLVILYGVWATGVAEGFLYISKGTTLTFVAVALGYAASKLVDQAFRRGFGIAAELQQRYPELEARANRYVPVIQTITLMAIYVLVVFAILQAWGMNVFGWLLSEPGRVLGVTVASIAGIIVVSFAIWEVTSFFVESYLTEKDKAGNQRIISTRTKTLLTVARKALLVVLVILASLLVLSELGFNIAPLLATAGVLGLAIGFGSQKLVQDVITGVFILIEDLFAVDDVIKVGDTAGLVEAVSIRNVRLRDFSGTVHTIPFSSISTISNLTKEFSFYVFDVGVAYRENVDEVMAVLKQIGEELQQDPEFGPLVKEPLEVVGVDRFADSAVVIKARIKTLPIKQWAVGREFNRRMKNRFDELGIEIPFPHQTIYFGEDKVGRAPAAHVNIDQAKAGEVGVAEKG